MNPQNLNQEPTWDTLVENSPSTEPKPVVTPEQADAMYKAPVAVEPKPADIARIQEIHESFKPSPQQAPATPEVPVKSPEQNESERLVTDYIGESLAGKTIAEVREDILLKKSEKAREANGKFFKVGGTATGLGLIGSMGAWVAAASGIGTATSIAGVPLMTAVAVGAAPVGLGIAAVAGTVWAARRFLNSRKADKAYNSF